jgi:hypothetical protein
MKFKTNYFSWAGLIECTEGVAGIKKPALRGLIRLSGLGLSGKVWIVLDQVYTKLIQHWLCVAVNPPVYAPGISDIQHTDHLLRHGHQDTSMVLSRPLDDFIHCVRIAGRATPLNRWSSASDGMPAWVMACLSLFAIVTLITTPNFFTFSYMGLALTNSIKYLC